MLCTRAASHAPRRVRTLGSCAPRRTPSSNIPSQEMCTRCHRLHLCFFFPEKAPGVKEMATPAMMLMPSAPYHGACNRLSPPCANVCGASSTMVQPLSKTFSLCELQTFRVLVVDSDSQPAGLLEMYKYA